MKFLASAIATAALILSGLVAAPTASAAPVYPGTVDTICSISVPTSRAGRRVFARIQVRTAGNGNPAGFVRITVFNNDGEAVRFRRVSYRGPAVVRVNLGKFKKGRYSATMKFDADENSVYRDCSDSDGFRVKPRRGRR